MRGAREQSVAPAVPPAASHAPPTSRKTGLCRLQVVYGTVAGRVHFSMLIKNWETFLIAAPFDLNHKRTTV